ncbi:Pop4p [Sugiyamaella lignohabitans]|uniref:Ribonuclease P protein subunit n=1 Tax=Sugiyamaella lignohabitans TaxID=796027 RepID=A0A167FT26_9ASCO|nr:Pop4p [Sugiyamaella lignohabitans]ANB15669.1 Pop4p [Sugiyamaella lignohabitans]
MARTSLEEILLSRSHSDERTKDLLATRYSVSGDQKPFLVLTPTKGNNKLSGKALVAPEAAGKEHKNNEKIYKSKKSQLTNARTALSDYILESKNCQKIVKSKLRSKQFNSVDELPSSLIANVPKYENFLELHRIWKLYITDLIYGSNASVSTRADRPSRAQELATATKLTTADFHGSLLKVTSSHNPTLIGLKGIVIWESKSSFVIVCESSGSNIGGLRILNKKGTRFSTTVYQGESDTTGYSYEILGSRLIYRTADRSNRKFKSRSIEDL